MSVASQTKGIRWLFICL